MADPTRDDSLGGPAFPVKQVDRDLYVVENTYGEQYEYFKGRPIPLQKSPVETPVETPAETSVETPAEPASAPDETLPQP